MVFRRGGPVYEFPKLIREEGYKMFCLTIDIAELKESGSSNRFPPEQITLEDLRKGVMKRQTAKQTKKKTPTTRRKSKKPAWNR